MGSTSSRETTHHTMHDARPFLNVSILLEVDRDLCAPQRHLVTQSLANATRPSRLVVEPRSRNARKSTSVIHCMYAIYRSRCGLRGLTLWGLGAPEFTE